MDNIMDDFVKIELAIRLKELGFNIPFFSYYRTDDRKLYHLVRTDPLVYGKDIIDDEVVIAPTISQVLKWFRDSKGIHINPEICPLGWYCSIYCFDKDVDGLYDVNDMHETTIKTGDNYDDAVLKGIQYVIDDLI